MKPPSSLTELKIEGQSETVTRGEARGRGAYSKGAAKREEILTGLMAAMAKGELRNPTLRTIARGLGLEPAHILYYFGSREELLQAVIQRWDDEAGARNRDGDGPARLTLDFYCETIRRNIAIPGVIHLYLTFAAEAVDTQHPAHDFFRERFARLVGLLAEAVRQEQDAGTIPAHADPRLQARLLIALADGLQLQSLVNPQVDAGGDLAAAVAELRGSGGADTTR